MTLQGKETKKNLMRAFAGESQARNRYTFYASVAKKQGYPHIHDLLMLVADQEKTHAKIFYKHLIEEFNGQAIEFDASYPVAFYPDDLVANIKAAAAGEHEEWEEIYPTFAAVAKEEGFPRIAASFTNIAKIEAEHERKFASLVDLIENDTLFKKQEVFAWHCKECGHIHYGVTAPKMCPVCVHPQGYFTPVAMEQA